MSYENFNQSTNNESAKPHSLNLCDIYELGNTLKSDLATYGPGLLSAAGQAKPETVLAAAASAALVTTAVVSGSEVLIGVGGAVGLLAAGKVVTDTLLPMITFQKDNTKR